MCWRCFVSEPRADFRQESCDRCSSLLCVCGVLVLVGGGFDEDIIWLILFNSVYVVGYCDLDGV